MTQQYVDHMTEEIYGWIAPLFEHDPDGTKGTMYLYNCVYNSKKETQKRRIGATHNETRI
jgi:hypothetical protein